MEDKKQVAIFSDAHALLEPVEAIVEDAKKQGIDQIYSLGDNIGVGTNPKEVIDVLMQNNVISLAGNHEESITLGVEPFLYYMEEEAVINAEWTKSKLTKEQLEYINSMPHFRQLEMGGKRIALCHFANDVRAEFNGGSCWTYKDRLDSGYPGYPQFAYTNSDRNIKDLAKHLRISWSDLKKLKDNHQRMLYMREFIAQNKYFYEINPTLAGCVSNVMDPLFSDENGLYTIKDYDALIQGHVHFRLEEKMDRLYYTLRGAGMGDTFDARDKAAYIILQENENGFDLIEKKIPFDYEKMQHSIMHSSMPDVSRIRKFTYTR